MTKRNKVRKNKAETVAYATFRKDAAVPNMMGRRALVEGLPFTDYLLTN